MEFSFSREQEELRREARSFLEANPNPDLTPHTFGRDCCFAGVSYPDLISNIVKAALSRPR